MGGNDAFNLGTGGPGWSQSTNAGSGGAFGFGGSSGGGGGPAQGPQRVRRWSDVPLGMGIGYSGGGGVNLAGMPKIGPSTVWNDQQINQRVNSMRGTNDQTAATTMQNQASSLGSKGFGGNSPLQQALGAQAQGQALAANTQGENDIRWNAAQGNAQQGLQASMGNAQATNWQNQAALQNQAEINRRQFNMFNAMSNMGAYGGYYG